MDRKPAAHFRRWDAEQDDELRRRCSAGESLRDISRALGRTQESCRNRANSLGVPCRS